LISVWEIDISNTSILIIGNGQSVLQQKLGTLVDSFSTIGRINNYSTAEFEDYVGSQTHIWFNGANQKLKKRKHFPDRIVVLIPAEILRSKTDSIHQRITRRLGISSSNYELASLDEMESWENRCGIIRPTTGTTSIMWAMDRFDEVIIHGFDFFIDSKAHYNDQKWMNWLIQIGVIKKASKHDMKSEKQFVENLLSTGKIKKLSEYE